MRGIAATAYERGIIKQAGLQVVSRFTASICIRKYRIALCTSTCCEQFGSLAQDQRQEEMKEVVEEIAAKEQQLSDGRAQLKTLGGQEAALKGQLADCERRQQVPAGTPAGRSRINITQPAAQRTGGLWTHPINFDASWPVKSCSWMQRQSEYCILRIVAPGSILQLNS